jgi:hypothetical protein
LPALDHAALEEVQTVGVHLAKHWCVQLNLATVYGSIF